MKGLKKVTKTGKEKTSGIGLVFLNNLNELSLQFPEY